MTLTTPYQASFYVGDGETKAFPFVFEEVSDNFVKVIVSHIDGTISIPTYTVDLDLKQVVFGDETPAPTADDIVCIYRETPTIQDTPFKTLEGYNAKALENILSKIVAMIQEIKSNYFSTQVLQGDPWQLDLLKSADDGATVNIDYVAKKLVKGLYFQITNGNLQVSADGSSYITMPKSADIVEFRQVQTVLEDLTVQYRLQYRIGNEWFNAESNAEATADEAKQIAEEARDIASDAKDIAQDAKDIADSFDDRLSQAEQDSSDAKDIAQTASDAVSGHITDTNNPHSVTVAQIGALPDTTKYGATLSLTINSTTYVVTAQLKDQDGNNLGTAQTIDLPLESVVVSGAYDSATKEVVLTLQGGSTIRFSVADLVSGLQTEITALNMLSADLVDDTSTTHKFVTSSDKSTWNGKQDAINDLSTIRSNATAGKAASDTIATYGDIVTHDVSEFATSAQGSKADTAVQPGDLSTVATTGDYTDLLNKPTIPTVNDATLTIQKNGTSVATFTANASSGVTANITVPTTTNDLTNNSGFITSSDIPVTDVTVGGISVVTSGVAAVPAIPTVNDATITITQGGVTKGSFTLNQASGDTIALDAGGGSSLPSQTGHAGEFLTTDGTDASWSNKPLVNKAVQTYSCVINTNPSAPSYSLDGDWNVMVGYNASVGSSACEQNVIIGYAAGVTAGTHTMNVLVGSQTQSTAKKCVVVGANSQAKANNAIQLGCAATNSDANTFKVANANGNFEIMSADGTIPTDRYTTTPSADGTYVPKLTISSGVVTRSWGADGIDYIVEKQDPSAGNNYTWYRKYKSGWVEQGQARVASADTVIQITFPVEMADTYYVWSIGRHIYDVTAQNTNERYMGVINRTTTGFNVADKWGHTYAWSWQVSGMAA